MPTFEDLEKESKKVSQMARRSNKYANYAERLPIDLKDEFRKRQDPALNKQVSEAEQEALGSAVVGLDRYKNISDPFERRALAEKYQGQKSAEYDYLASERDRRKGKFEDYIERWSGLYGAEAAKRQNMLTAAQDEYSRMSNLSQSQREQSRWEQEFAEDKRRWGAEHALSQARESRLSDDTEDDDFLAYAAEEINASQGEDGYADPRVYERILAEAREKGYDKSKIDAEFGYEINPRDAKRLGLETEEKKSSEGKNMETLIDQRTKEGRVAATREQAKVNDYYWDGSVLRQKKDNSWLPFNAGDKSKDPIIYDPNNSN